MERNVPWFGNAGRALMTLARASVGLPVALAAVFGRGPRAGRVGVGRRTLRVAVGLGESAVGLLAAVIVGRVVTYPFWAAGASHDALSRSWGGPSPLGATLVHWVVGAAILVGCYVVVRLLRAADVRLAGTR